MILKQRLHSTLQQAHTNRIARSDVRLDTLIDYSRMLVPHQTSVHAVQAIEKCADLVKEGKATLDEINNFLLSVISTNPTVPGSGVSAGELVKTALAVYVDIHPRVSDDSEYMAVLGLLRETINFRVALEKTAALRKEGKLAEAIDLLGLSIALLNAVNDNASALKLEKLKNELIQELAQPLDDVPISKLTLARINRCDNVDMLINALRRDDVQRTPRTVIQIIERIAVLDESRLYDLESDPTIKPRSFFVHLRIVESQKDRIEELAKAGSTSALLDVIRANPPEPKLFAYLTDEAAQFVVNTLIRLEGDKVLNEIVDAPAGFCTVAVNEARHLRSISLVAFPASSDIQGALDGLLVSLVSTRDTADERCTIESVDTAARSVPPNYDLMEDIIFAVDKRDDVAIKAVNYIAHAPQFFVLSTLERFIRRGDFTSLSWNVQSIIIESLATHVADKFAVCPETERPAVLTSFIEHKDIKLLGKVADIFVVRGQDEHLTAVLTALLELDALGEIARISSTDSSPFSKPRTSAYFLQALERRFTGLEVVLTSGGNSPFEIEQAVSEVLYLALEYPTHSEQHVDRILDSLIEKGRNDVLAKISEASESGGAHGA